MKEDLQLGQRPPPEDPPPDLYEEGTIDVLFPPGEMVLQIWKDGEWKTLYTELLETNLSQDGVEVLPVKDQTNEVLKENMSLVVAQFSYGQVTKHTKPKGKIKAVQFVTVFSYLVDRERAKLLSREFRRSKLFFDISPSPQKMKPKWEIKKYPTRLL